MTEPCRDMLNRGMISKEIVEGMARECRWAGAAMYDTTTHQLGISIIFMEKFFIRSQLIYSFDIMLSFSKTDFDIMLSFSKTEFDIMGIFIRIPKQNEFWFYFIVINPKSSHPEKVCCQFPRGCFLLRSFPGGWLAFLVS